ncbi:hypothetical protein GW17_00011143 [Ensete ventricosum]|nr:hypothetical protein GW17_00011143 [Ensete ventricosum]
MTTITSGRSSTSKLDVVDLYHLNANHDKDKHPETVKPSKAFDSVECSQTVTMKETEKKRSNSHVRSLTSFDSQDLNLGAFCQPQQVSFGRFFCKLETEHQSLNETESSLLEYEGSKDLKICDSAPQMTQTSGRSSSQRPVCASSPVVSSARSGSPPECLVIQSPAREVDCWSGGARVKREYSSSGRLSTPARRSGRVGPRRDPSEDQVSSWIGPFFSSPCAVKVHELL